MFHVFMFHVPSVFSLLFLVFRVIAVEEGNSTECDSLKEIQNKVTSLWENWMPPQSSKADSDGNYYATCELRPSKKLDANELAVTGHVLFKQNYPIGKLEVIFEVDGFPTEDNHTLRAIHIHEFGDLSDGCDSTAGHYNPFGVHHPRHPGDFGNFDTSSGKIRKRKGNLQATLFGPYSVLGRSIVVHKYEDDLGKGGNQASIENGNAGKRLACCVIGLCSKTMWEKVSPVYSETKLERSSRRVKGIEGKISKKRGAALRN
ncbi:extracellular superoxide dismutase [Cu-Zn] [Pleurodeles waltl]